MYLTCIQVLSLAQVQVKQALKRFADESEQQKAAVKLARQQWSVLAPIAREGLAPTTEPSPYAPTTYPSG